METKLRDAYFAGLIDGEGTIDVFSHLAGRQRRPIVKVDMTCEKTVKALHQHFGGYIGQKKTADRHKPQWRWEVTYVKAREVAQRIRPFLITKADNADRVLAAPVRPVGWNLTKAGRLEMKLRSPA